MNLTALSGFFLFPFFLSLSYVSGRSFSVDRVMRRGDRSDASGEIVNQKNQLEMI